MLEDHVVLIRDGLSMCLHAVHVGQYHFIRTRRNSCMTTSTPPEDPCKDAVPCFQRERGCAFRVLQLRKLHRYLRARFNHFSKMIDANCSYVCWDGTAMVSPHVAGVAALLLRHNTAATPTQVSSAILGNATTGVLSSLGTGLPNMLLYNLITGPVTPPPSAPTGLTATAISSSAISLS